MSDNQNSRHTCNAAKGFVFLPAALAGTPGMLRDVRLWDRVFPEMESVHHGLTAFHHKIKPLVRKLER
jgi:hypothetical protein